MSSWEPAYKLNISDILEGQLDHFSGSNESILTTKSGIRTSRVRIMGTVVNVFKGELTNYMNFTVDDGTGTIRVKIWGKPSIMNYMKIGDIVDVLGLVRFYKNEIYLVPELMIKVEDPNWELVRELEKHLFSLLDIGRLPGPRHVSLHEAILKIIDRLDMGNGVSKETLEKLLNVPNDELEKELRFLLKEGIIYETRSNFYRRLGDV